ncbi:MAG: baseplate J/gp47 family protein [Eubacteriales bacterium]|nr:baseplate J/gp47 family protein [Eubacteriales bacterium]
MDIKKSLQSYPEISFIDNMTIDQMQGQMIDDFQKKYRELTGRELPLAKADPFRMILYACCLQLYQGMQYSDSAAKQGLLKYSFGDALENLGALKRVSRSQGAAATARLRFTLSATRPAVVLIPAQTRVTAGDQIYFQTVENLEIPMGSLTGEVTAQCRQTGTIGNDYAIGELKTLVDPVPYVDSVTNITVSDGGADVEDDESLAERIYLAPSSFSTAGPDDAYIYWVKTFDTAIEDVLVMSPEPGVVDIRFTMAGGEIPEESVTERLQEYLAQEDIRPFTDHVKVQTPDQQTYAIDLTYWINNSDRTQAAVIQNGVEDAVKRYTAWQREKIGRDINPDKLRALIIAAGAKRVEIRAPDYTVLSKTALAIMEEETKVLYGGIEDD